MPSQTKVPAASRSQSEASRLTAYGAPISVYTAEDAVADGVLVDAQQGEFAEVTRQHHGDTPVYMTRHLFCLIERAVEHPRACNDWKGVWHDVCFMSSFVLQGANAGDRRRFRVIITGCGRKRNHILVAVWNGQSVTYMFNDED